LPKLRAVILIKFGSRRGGRVQAVVGWLLASLLWVGASQLRAEERVYPPDVFEPLYFVDVTKPPYDVDNTGKEDATDKIKQAIVDIYHGGFPALRYKTLYFPNGTYRLSDTLDAMTTKADGKPGPAHRLTWIGESRDGTILKLDDNLPAFQDPTKPKAIIRTVSIGSNGNDAYDNCIWNMTLDVGAGNPGAAGIDYLANNNGMIRDVLIRAAPGSGAAGLLMTRMWPGPDLVKNLEVDGFDYGVHIARMEYGITFEHLVLRGQRKAGIRNEDNAPFIRDLDSINEVPAIDNAGAGGLVVLVDASLKGGKPDAPAILNNAGLFLRNVTTEGYGEGVRNLPRVTGPGAPAGTIAEYNSDPVLTNKFPSSRTTSLNLEIRETPHFVDNDFKNWYSVGNNTQPNGKDIDQADAIQAAIDAAAAQGKTTFYFIPGQYVITHSLVIHGSIRRVLGLGTVLRPKGGGAFSDAANPQPVFLIKDLVGDDVEISQFTLFPDQDHPPGYYGYLHDSPKTLVLVDLTGPTVCYRGTAQAGDVYIEGCLGSTWIFDRPGQHIWARQFNTEGGVPCKITNVGATLWILGLKTERPGILIDSRQGAQTEVLGGLFYPVGKPTDDPMFRVEDSRFSASYVTVIGNANPDCPNQLTEIRHGESQTLHKEDIHPRPCFGGALAALATLMVAAPADGAPTPASPVVPDAPTTPTAAPDAAPATPTPTPTGSSS